MEQFILDDASIWGDNRLTDRQTDRQTDRPLTLDEKIEESQTVRSWRMLKNNLGYMLTGFFTR